VPFRHRFEILLIGLPSLLSASGPAIVSWKPGIHALKQVHTERKSRESGARAVLKGKHVCYRG